MKPATTPKELLKPPFTVGGNGFIVDGNFRSVLSITKSDAVEFIAEALNEKWERDYGEPLRWKFSDGKSWYICPKCGDVRDGDGSPPKHCSTCGQKLLPPETEVST